jgi:hypothetical protein
MALQSLHFPLELVFPSLRKLAIKLLFDRVDLAGVEAEAGRSKCLQSFVSVAH